MYNGVVVAYLNIINWKCVVSVLYQYFLKIIYNAVTHVFMEGNEMNGVLGHLCAHIGLLMCYFR